MRALVRRRQPFVGAVFSCLCACRGAGSYPATTRLPSEVSPRHSAGSEVYRGIHVHTRACTHTHIARGAHLAAASAHNEAFLGECERRMPPDARRGARHDDAAPLSCTAYSLRVANSTTRCRTTQVRAPCAVRPPGYPQLVNVGIPSFIGQRRSLHRVLRRDPRTIRA